MKHVFFLLATAVAGPAWADMPRIVDVAASDRGGVWRFDVTVAHGDEGWDHYADAWEIRDADGNVLGTRVLAHPHVNEQPFTRSLGDVTIPPDVNSVWVVARDSVHGLGQAIEFVLPK